MSKFYIHAPELMQPPVYVMMKRRFWFDKKLQNFDNMRDAERLLRNLRLIEKSEDSKR